MWFYNINNVVAALGYFLPISLLLLVKLQKSFMNSAYAVSKSEMRRLYMLAAAYLTTFLIAYTLNDIRVISRTVTGQIILVIMNLCLFITGVAFITRVDYMCVK